MHQNKNTHHIPVLLQEILSVLSPQPGDAYLDLTAGYGGHAKQVLGLTNAPQDAVLIDRDENAQDVLSQEVDKSVTRLHMDFEEASKQLLQEKRTFNVVLADLGVSSPHLNNAGRGFSIQADGPLDMRMDPSQSFTAEELVNTYSMDQIARILQVYGEEPKAYKIAQAIVNNRPITRTTQLADIIKACWPGYSKVHPATRAFQALRIAVNDELGMLERSLPIWIELLKPGGRLAIITFHSLEDRIVKQYFKEQSHGYGATIELPFKKPVTASKDELVSNPRARSAKLRVAVKIKRKG